MEMKDFQFNSNYLLGICFILICALIWAGASVLMQYVYEDLDFNSPFVVTYWANSLMMIYLPLWQILVHFQLVKDCPKHSENGSRNHVLNSVDQSEMERLENYSSEDDNSLPVTPFHTSSEKIDDRKQKTITAYSHRDIIKIAIIIAPVWFIANCLYNYSLLWTSVSSSTVLSNTSASFTLAFAWLTRLEDLTIYKVLGVMICFGGAVMVGEQDAESSDYQSNNSIVGDIAAVIASVGYGLYTTIIRYQIPNDEVVPMQLVLGYIGLINGVILSPIILMLYLTKIGNLSLITGKVAGFIILNGFVDNVISDYLWARSVVLTSPTIATIGMSITIPIAMVTDYLLSKGVPNALSGTGAVLVIIGFILVNLKQEHVDQFVSWLKQNGWFWQSHPPFRESVMTSSNDSQLKTSFSPLYVYDEDELKE